MMKRKFIALAVLFTMICSIGLATMEDTYATNRTFPYSNCGECSWFFNKLERCVHSGYGSFWQYYSLSSVRSIKSWKETTSTAFIGGCGVCGMLPIPGAKPFFAGLGIAVKFLVGITCAEIEAALGRKGLILKVNNGIPKLCPWN